MDESIKQAARELRKSQTPAEEVIWQLVKSRRLAGKRFLRQHPIRVDFSESARYFIADFYCPACRLVIEIDGKIHEYQQEYDELRTYLLNQRGVRVIRLKNDELTDINRLIEKISKALA